MKKNHGKKLGKRNLMIAYAFDTLLTITLSKIEKPEHRVWLTEQQRRLQKWGRLYPDTAEKINKWFLNHLGKRYALSYDGFYGDASSLGQLGKKDS